MALEQDIANLVQAANGLTQVVDGKIQQIDQQVAVKEAQVDQFLQEAPQHFILSTPLNNNAFLIGGAAGYGATGNVSVSAVHPYTRGFEGPYTADRGSATAASEESSTQTTPYYYGRYNKGPRASRGGIAGGWQGVSNGHVLRLSKPAGGQHNYANACVFSLNKHIKLSQFIFRAYVWVQSGPLYFGVGPYDSGGNNITIPSHKEWHPINQLCVCSEVTSKNNWRIRLTSPDAQEIYIAMMNIFAVEDIGNDFTLMNME